MDALGLSERRACRIVALSRSASRYQLKRTDDGPDVKAMLELAGKHSGIGYQQLCKRLRRAGWKMNRKRVYRLYVKFDLGKRKKRVRVKLETQGTPKPTEKINETWSIDFMADRLNNGQAYRLFAVVDRVSRKCLELDVNRSMPASRVISVLNRIATRYGLPKQITCDNGPEFRSHTLLSWGRRNGVHIHFIDPGRPMQNGYVESFNGTFRAECVGMFDIDTISEARLVVKEWVNDYNHDRPHSSLGDLTPHEFEAANERVTFRPLIDGRATRADNIRPMEKLKTQEAAFPTFPQALPPLLLKTVP